MTNTKQKGILRFVVYPEGKHYIGVCLDLNIIEEGDDFYEVWENLKEASLGYVETVEKEGLRDHTLNQKTPREYWDKYQKEVERAFRRPLGQTMVYTLPIGVGAKVPAI